MSFSIATVTHTYQNADGTPGSGEVIFTLQGAMTNGSVTIMPTHVTSTINAAGQINQTLASTDDSGTTPGNVFWRVDEKIIGAGGRTFNIQVPSGGVSVDLGTLMPFVTPPEFG